MDASGSQQLFDDWDDISDSEFLNIPSEQQSIEREIQDVVPVHICTREDAEAIKLLNMLHMIPLLEAGDRVREFPVFGVQEGVFVMGVIDELMYNQKGELVLNELKTRKQNSLPSSAQDKVNCFQVGLYKLLFDGLVRGEVKKDHVLNHLKLRSSQVLGAGIQAHAKSIGVQIEYYHQGSSGPIGTRVAPFDEAQIRAELQGHLTYWKEWLFNGSKLKASSLYVH
ncbi:exonuclease V-like isoform X2 [Labeo rohita]|uniref:Exonuclease V-like isoform X2 n=1 Tax=Labeo rohita TaxID=84645 RepID=A0A498LQF7_LABRO|nr:exonuclease V-like isoform X2 [Labeo rohita]